MGIKQLMKMIESWTESLLQFARQKTWSNSRYIATCMGEEDKKRANLKTNLDANNEVKSHVHLWNSIPQKCVTNFVFLQFSGHQNWYRHLLKSDASGNNSDNVVTTYAVSVGNRTLITAHMSGGLKISSVSSLWIAAVNFDSA